MSWKTFNLGQLIDHYSVRAKDHETNTSELEFCGVSNEDGITKSKYAAEDKAEEYKIIEKGCFAYNPYRVNVGSVGYLKEEITALISPAYVVFKTKTRSIVPELLLKFLKSSEGLRQIKLNARGTVRQALRFEDLCKIEITIPSYDEQISFFKRIEVTESKYSLLNDELYYQLFLVKQLRQAFLREAMQGKLVPQDPNDEPASVLLEKIKKEKEQLIQEKKIKKEKPLTPVSKEEIPFEIPENWVWCRLGEITQSITYGTSVKTKDYGEIPVLRMGNITTEGKILFSNLKYTDPTIDDLPKLYLQNNDLLFNRTNSFELVGKSAVFKEKDEKYTCASYLIIVRHIISSISNFNSYFINSQLCRKTQLEPNIIQQNGQANFNGSKLANILTPLPPLEEQHRIVSKLDQLMSYCDDLEASIQTSLQQNELLLQQVLREALEPKEAQLSEAPIVSLPVTNSKAAGLFSAKEIKVRRKMLAAYLVNLSLDDKQFGKTKFEKLLHLTEYHILKHDYQQSYTVQAAGPYDGRFTNTFWNETLKSKWFALEEYGKFKRIVAGEQHERSTKDYGYYTEAEKTAIQSLVQLFRKDNYELPEIVSTLYAVWNNRIIRNERITDELLKQDFLNWDEGKARYKDRLDIALNWMQDKGIVPDGWGKVIGKK